MQTIKILKDQEARKGSLAAQKWAIIKKHDGKSVDDLKKAMEKGKLPKARHGLSWHVRREFIELVEVAGEDAPAKCKPAKPCAPAANKFENLVGQ